MRILGFLPALCLWWALSGSTGWAAPANQAEAAGLRARLEVSLGQQQVPINRTADLTLVVEWPGDPDAMTIPDPPQPACTNFKVLSMSAEDRVSDTTSGRITRRLLRYRLTPVALGMGYVEPVRITYRPAAGGPAGALGTSRLGLQVVAAVSDAPPHRPRVPLVVALSVLVVAGLAGWLFWRRRRSGPAEAQAPAALDPGQHAMARLRRMEDLKLAGRLESWFSGLTALIREYLYLEWNLRIQGLSPLALRETLLEAGWSPESADQARDLFALADRVKFAHEKPAADVVEWAHNIAVGMLDLKRPGSPAQGGQGS